MKENKPTSQKKLLVLSFVEGACVMVAELAGGKMLAPYYGTSLYVWASTLALTLGGLTIGYYLGGELSKRPAPQRQKALFLTIAVASALVVIMPVWANAIMQQTLEMNFLAGVMISQLLFLFPPILGMGIVSPMLISMIAENQASGKAAGLVYAISTMGGVIATLLTGFALVPVMGISIPCVVAGSLLFLLNIWILRPNQKLAVAALVILLIPSALFIKTTRENLSEKYKIIYHSEGMLGQIKIIDFPHTENGKTINSRCMFVNHNWQTWIDRDNPDFSFLFYTRFTKAMISAMQPGNRALLIGLGGGTVARQLEQYNIDYDVVEIDGRLPELAEKYFGLKKAVANTIVDDGRHYINVCKKKYDLVIIDALLGENIPSHLLSVECFREIKNILAPGGKIFIEFDGLPKEANNIAPYALHNTIREAGYDCRVYSSVPDSKEFDLMFVASEKGTPHNYDTASIVADFYYPFTMPMNKTLTDLSNPQITTLITDDKPVLDYYLREKMLVFREQYMKTYREEFLLDGVPFYY